MNYELLAVRLNCQFIVGCFNGVTMTCFIVLLFTILHDMYI